MGHARGAKHVPIGAFDAALVAHEQGTDQARPLGIGDARLHPFAHPLPPLRHAVLPRGFQSNRCRVMAARAHIARGPQALPPHPQLKVKSVGIDLTVGLLEPHHHAPALPGPQSGNAGVVLQAPTTGIPTQQHLGGGLHALALPFGRLDGQAKTQAVFGALGQGRHHADHGEVAPLQIRCQQAFGMPHGTHARQSKHQTPDRKKHGQPPTARPTLEEAPAPEQRHQGHQGAHGISPDGPQRLVPKVNGAGGDTRQGRRGDAVCAAAWVHAPSQRGDTSPTRERIYLFLITDKLLFSAKPEPNLVGWGFRAPAIRFRLGSTAAHPCPGVARKS